MNWLVNFSALLLATFAVGVSSDQRIINLSHRLKKLKDDEQMAIARDLYHKYGDDAKVTSKFKDLFGLDADFSGSFSFSESYSESESDSDSYSDSVSYSESSSESFSESLSESISVSDSFSIHRSRPRPVRIIERPEIHISISESESESCSSSESVEIIRHVSRPRIIDISLSESISESSSESIENAYFPADSVSWSYSYSNSIEDDYGFDDSASLSFSASYSFENDLEYDDSESYSFSASYSFENDLELDDSCSSEEEVIYVERPSDHHKTHITTHARIIERSSEEIDELELVTKLAEKERQRALAQRHARRRSKKHRFDYRRAASQSAIVCDKQKIMEEIVTERYKAYIHDIIMGDPIAWILFEVDIILTDQETAEAIARNFYKKRQCFRGKLREEIDSYSFLGLPTGTLLQVDLGRTIRRWITIIVELLTLGAYNGRDYPFVLDTLLGGKAL